MDLFLLTADTMTNKAYLDVANSPMMWAVVIPTVIMVCIQAYVFIQDAIKAGPIVGLTKQDTKEAMRAGAICSIGPGLSMFTVMIALMSILGGPFAWLRLSIIGTITTEMLGATAAATAMGVDLGGPDYGITAFSCAVWVITLNTWGFFIVNLLFAHRMEKVKMAVERHDAHMFDAVGLCVMIGCVAMFLAGQMVGGTGKFIAAIAGFIIMTILIQISEKYPKLKEYNLGIAMLAAIFIAQFVVQIGG
ncbi:hypothetical protein CLNEO_15010 [Anaerotignum neopropionicum]|uniref:DUF5058 family protein n=1 Tax=Anaerotignum neopropionicum TaxID=36847 RepID=A0A136WF33_9FIRM|nr:DUF5058 family protein [Anaerotignum neopropionicum]KXL52959.1 hypothetical protein CLNEO_15010 [Anaerotignum neopropionicum]